jgi:DNA-binding PadR family transcriptional regulator
MNNDNYEQGNSQYGNRPFGSFNFGQNAGHWRMHLGQRGWIRPTVLKILQEKPMNGMEIMSKINEMSHGWWKPSPGSIYPLLESLASEGIVTKNKDGKYELSKKYVGTFGPMDDADDVITNMEGSASYLEELSKSDKAKFAKYKARIEKLGSRISKIK